MRKMSHQGNRQALGRSVGCCAPSSWRAGAVVLMLTGLVGSLWTVSCSFDTSGLSGGSSGVCGNGVKEAGEVCDGADLGGKECVDFSGFSGGTLACGQGCASFDTSFCTFASCGNGVAEGNEECDGSDLNGHTCSSLGYLGGTLTCGSLCRFDLTGCEMAECGNSVREGVEVCDGQDLGGATCQTLGLGDGALGCMPDCSDFDTSRCSGQAACGDGVVEGNEVCDGANLDGQSCESLDLGSGALECAPDCLNFDTSGCVQPDGGPCTSDSQCAGGICWEEAGEGNFPGGFCTRDCSSQSCPGPTGVCFEVGPGRRCYQECDTSSECRQGYACFDEWDSGMTICRPHCVYNAQCPATGQCNLWTGRCEGPTTGGENGDQVVDGVGCKSRHYVYFNERSYCVSHCDLTAPVCPGDDICSDVFGAGAGDLGLCLRSCDTPADCTRSGFYCVSNPYGSGQVCLPN
jgi:hypothetical protein